MFKLESDPKYVLVRNANQGYGMDDHFWACATSRCQLVSKVEKNVTNEAGSMSTYINLKFWNVDHVQHRYPTS